MWRVVLLFSFNAAAAAAAAGLNGSHCERLHADAGNRPPLPTKVTLLWGAAPAYAAAALLRAALIAAGARPAAIVLHREPSAARLCSLLGGPPPRVSTGQVTLALATEWRPEADECTWDKVPRALRVQGAGAAPATARLHVRLAPPHDTARACEAAAEWPFYEDVVALRECGFADGARGSNETRSAIVYVLEGEWEGAGKALRKGLNGARLHFESVTRSSLARVLADPDHSFLFLDAELWHNASGVCLVEPPPAAAAAVASAVSLRVADENALRVYAPALHVMFTNDEFKPSSAVLRTVLARATDVGGVDEAACMLANDLASAPGVFAFAQWRNAVSKKLQYKGLVVVCIDGGKDNPEYGHAAVETARYVEESTPHDGLILYIKVIAVDCDDRDSLSREIIDLQNIGQIPRMAFVIARADLIPKAASSADDFGLPLLAYDVPDDAAPPPRTSTGRATHLALALRRLLTTCRWRRLAIVSDSTTLATAVAVALGPTGLNVSPGSVNSTSESINPTLLRLAHKDEVRVFFVNAGANVTAAVLAEARSLGLTPARGYTWIVREYAKADNATKALAPYSVSFQWRGPTAEVPAPTGRPAARVLDKLEKMWKGRAWPSHAAALIDAILTLAEGYVRLVKLHPEMMDYENRESDKLRYFWEEIQNENISGIVQDMKYGEYGVVAPLVFVERWEADPRPRRLVTWPAGELGDPENEMCPGVSNDELRPVDGTVWCLSGTGDGFPPRCDDVAWLCTIVALLAVSAGLVFGFKRARAALRRRDACIRAKVTASMLARRSRVFVALTPHLVERAALDLREELGAGSFGRVRLGLLRTPGRDRPVLVAAKALWEDAAPAEETQFLKEACTLAALDHEHVVRFAGVCVEDGPPLLLMEHAFFGDLLRYLQARRHLVEGAAPNHADAAGPEEAAYVSAEALTRLAHEAAAGLAYLATRGLVHRDVRASNCLVDARRSLKLADFGLARETGTTDGEYAFRGRAMCPVLRMAPESLEHGVCSAASDAWAFGVLALELVTLGARPYGDASLSSVVRRVKAGGRPPLPRDASAETRALVRACCQREASARPTAARLAAWLKARCHALRPALAADLDDVDADSGYGEPATPLDGPDAPDAPTHSPS